MPINHSQYMLQIEAALNMYYELAGWDVETGMPTKNKLEQLELAWVFE